MGNTGSSPNSPSAGAPSRRSTIARTETGTSSTGGSRPPGQQLYNYEEARELLLQFTPWDDFIQFSPLGPSTEEGSPQPKRRPPVYPLDTLDTAMANSSKAKPPYSLIPYKSACAGSSLNDNRKSSINRQIPYMHFDSERLRATLLANLGLDNLSTETLDYLEKISRDTSLAEMPQTFLLARSLRNSTFPIIRAAGFALLSFICRHHSPLSAIRCRWVWYIMWGSGLDEAEEPRCQQFALVAKILEENPQTAGLNGCIVPTLEWIKSGVEQGLLDSHRAATSFHTVGNMIIGSEAVHTNEAQVVAVIALYCALVTRALQIESSPVEVGKFNHKTKLEREPSQELDSHTHLKTNASHGRGTSSGETWAATPDTDLKSKRVLNHASEEETPILALTIETATHLLHEIVELVIPLDMLSTEELTEPFVAFATVLGHRVARLAPSSSEEDEHWIRATAISHDFIQRLLSSKIHDLGALEIIENHLSGASSKDIPVAVGALEAYGEHLCRKIDIRFSRLSMDEAMDSQNADDSITFGELLHLLEEVPHHWIEKRALEPVFNSLARLIRRILCHQNWDSSFRLSQFVCISISHLVAAVVEIMRFLPSPNLFRLSMQDDNNTSEGLSLRENVEVLMRELLSNPQMPKDLVPTFLSIADSLDDENLLLVLDKGWRLLSPVHSDWAGYMRSLVQLYCKKAPGYPQSRRSMVTYIERTLESIADVEIFHGEVKQDIAVMFKATLPFETDEQILQAAFRILDREVAVSASSNDEVANANATSLCESWAKVAITPCKCHLSSLQRNSDAVDCSPEDCTRQLLAVQFIVRAFQNLAFPTALLLPGLLNGVQADEISSAGRFTVYLFQKILRMSSLGESGEAVPCPKARLALLQWLLRLRADSKHHIYVLDGHLPELIPTATMAQRYIGAEHSSFWTQNNDALRRRRQERENSITQKRANTKGRKVQGQKDDLNSTQTLWQVPDVLKIEIPAECTRKSPSMVTRQPNDMMNQEHTLLPISLYISFICDTLSQDTNWEHVSYILCHLPVQLFNSHLFCAFSAQVELERLAKVICNAIANDKLYKQMTHIRPRSLCSGQIKALLVQTLAVFIGHHEWLQGRDTGPVNGPPTQNLVVESLIQGLSQGTSTRGHCLQALTLAIYEIPEVLTRYTCRIVETLTTLATNSSFSVLILEYLFALAHMRELYSSTFRDMDYKRVFGLGLMHIQNHAKNRSMKTSTGNESYSLAQHIHQMSYTLIYVWFLAIPADNRIRFVQFIADGLADAAAENPSRAHLTEVAMDWLAHYTYANVDNTPHPSFLYKSIFSPNADMARMAPTWAEKKHVERENTADSMAFKEGNAIIMVSTLKQPTDWARVVVTRAAGETEFFCHIEGLKRVSPCSDMDVPHDGEILPEKEQEGASVDLCLNKNATGTSLVTSKPALIAPALIPAVFRSIHAGLQGSAQVYQNMDGLSKSLEVLHHTPSFNVHRVGLLYVAPGQTQELEILSNQHGSLTYSHVVSRLGRLMSGVQWVHALMGCRPDTHGKHVMSWWDDITNISFHVATMMPNIHGCLFKKQQIGNDAVKIIWNNGGRPFDMRTLPSAFNLFNILVEPHSRAASASTYATSLSKYFKVSIQTAPGMPPVTPLQGYKIVTLEALPSVLRHSALLACHFCEAWINTGEDGDVRHPLVTNRESRLRCIKATSKYLHHAVGSTG